MSEAGAASTDTETTPVVQQPATGDADTIKSQPDLAQDTEPVNPMDELDIKEDDNDEAEGGEVEEDDEDDTVSPTATVVPSNTPVTADSGQGSPTMQSSSDSLSDELAGTDNATGGSALADGLPTTDSIDQTSVDEPAVASAPREIGQGEATAAASAKEAKKIERKEEKKKQKKQHDKGIEYITRALNSLQTPEEKLAALCKKFADLNEEHRLLQNSHKTQQRTMTMVMREKDTLQADHTRAMMAKSKLESLCRELQKHNKMIKEESVKRAKEDDDKRKEISAQFNSTIGEIQTQMTENTERNNKLRQENENLASQLKAFINSIELRDQQVDKLQKHHDLEKQLFEAKMKQADAILAEQQEKSNKERELIMLKLAESNKKNAVMEAQVTMFKERYAEFEQLHSRSSETFQKYKTEMDKMTKRIKKLEKDGLAWKSKWEKTNKALIEQVEARSKSEKETLTYAQKANKLESLCRALQGELRNKKASEDTADGSASSPAETDGATPSTSSAVPPNSPEASSPDSTDEVSSSSNKEPSSPLSTEQGSEPQPPSQSNQVSSTELSAAEAAPSSPSGKSIPTEKSIDVPSSPQLAAGAAV